MADLNHWWGDDLVLTPSGDLSTVSGLPKDNQRIFRRLCTNGNLSGAKIGEYVFHPEYGGSAPWYVGQTTTETELEGVIRQQMFMEASVAHSPEPDITTNMNPNGTFSVQINYFDANNGLPVPTLILDVTE